MELTIHNYDDTDIVEIRIVGELDVFSCVGLKEKIDEFFTTSRKCLVINLQKTTYLDSRGTGILIYGNTRSKKEMRRYYLLNVHGSVRKVLELTKLIGFLKLIDSMEEIKI